MNIGILSRRPALYSTRRLREAAQALGHTPQVIDPMHCVLVLENDSARIELEGQAVTGLEVVIPRVGSYALEYGIAVVQHFRLQGVASLNEPESIALAKNKLASLQRLRRERVPVPDTALVRWPGHIREVVCRLGGPPVVLKTLRGSQGAGVILAESIEAVESILDTLWTFGQDAVVQRFVAESRGRDLRAFVINGEIVAAMRRTARAGDFRSNIHRGGTAERVELSAEHQRVALAAAQAVGCRVCGVDLLDSNRGPLVLEVNASPGFQALEEVTRLDIAALIVREAVRAAQSGTCPPGHRPS